MNGPYFRKLINKINEATINDPSGKGTGDSSIYKIIDPKTGKVQGPRGIEYFPVAKDGSVVWDRKAYPDDSGGYGDKENAIRNLQLQGFKVGGDPMSGRSDYSKDTKGAYVPRRDALDDFDAKEDAAIAKQNKANNEYYAKKNRNLAKQLGFNSRQEAENAYNAAGSAEKARLQKEFDRAEYQYVEPPEPNKVEPKSNIVPPKTNKVEPKMRAQIVTPARSSDPSNMVTPQLGTGASTTNFQKDFVTGPEPMDDFKAKGADKMAAMSSASDKKMSKMSSDVDKRMAQMQARFDATAPGKPNQ